MSTLSDLVQAHGPAPEADIEWLHLLVGDWQLLAGLAFADIVLWVPTSEGSFVAVAHARPSSSSTLVYRDLLGQEIKPEWETQVAEAFEGAKIVDIGAPAWYEDTPTRVRAVPVLRGPSPSGKDLSDALSAKSQSSRTLARDRIEASAARMTFAVSRVVHVTALP